MDTNALVILVIEGILFMYLLYVLATMGSAKPKAEKVAVKPEEILAPEPEPEAEPEPEPEAAPAPEPSEAPSRPGIKIIDIEGIGPVYTETLNGIGIYTTEDLLDAGASRSGRSGLVEKSGISPKLILEWVNLADLFRVSGIGEEYSDLLEEAGVDTVPELAQRNPVNLHATLIDVNQAKNLVRRLPSLSMVEDWVRQAKSLPRRMEY
jgi:predicted flap endonuclease-1-like 5' DNA nuclease